MFGDYLTALRSYATLSTEARTRVAERLSAFVGIAPAALLKSNLRVAAFRDSLLREEKMEVGQYDSRFTLPLVASARQAVSDDPAMAQYTPAFIVAGNIYFREELKADFDVPYVAIEWARANMIWDYGRGPGLGAGPGPRDTTASDTARAQSGRPTPVRDQNFSNDLARAMRRNPDLRLFIGTGYYDLTTTIGAARELLARSPIDQNRVLLRDYESGHMPYLGAESLKQIATDVRQFIKSASVPNRARPRE